MKDDIFAGNTRAKLAFDVEQQAFGNLEPCLAGCITNGSIGRANAGRKCTKRTIGAGVAVGTNDKVACAHNALLGQKRMLNAHAANLVVVRNALFTSKIARHLGLFGALDVFIGNVMVGYQSDFRRVENLVYADLLELLDCHRCGNVVGKHQIEVALDKLARNHFFETRVGREDLLSHGHGTWHVLSFTAC